ncbi:L-serine ammonia-lyase, iron-sulfur-dependent, subunit alpha, partial [Candidatus Peregrinibacteria bacterium]|nr:L-serine ammonia-lyase, iron-sulfur-dependent, subunit alpha [Candidatus Peregrinibacteria bacterium]
MKSRRSKVRHLKTNTKKYHISTDELAKRYEAERSNKSVGFVRNKMKQTRDIMHETIQKGIKSTEKSTWGLSGGDSHKMYKMLKKSSKMMGNKLTIKAMAYAMATGEQNSCMRRIVAFPTAGGSGVVPGVLFSSSEHFKAGKRKLLRGMFCASAIGLIIAKGATLSAAKGGCQAEIGVAVAMAAAGLTAMRDGTPEQCFDAAAIGL